MLDFRNDQEVLLVRINSLMWIVVAVFAMLAGSFWWVQGVQAEKFRNLSEANRLREVIVRARRGLILDRDGRILADNEPSYRLVLSRSDLREMQRVDPSYRDRLITFLATRLEIPSSEVEARIERGRRTPLSQPLAIADNLTVGQVAEFQANRLSYPVLDIDPIQRRHYRYGTFASHVLGFMGEVTEKDLSTAPELAPGDTIGKRGVELVYDRSLRGRDGVRYVVVDSHGRILEEYEPARRDAIPGKNIRLTIDSDLQARAEQYFIENEMIGSCVVLDPRTGEILVLVSSPAYDSNIFSGRFKPEVWRAVISNPFRIEINRAIQGLYSPGSVFKIVMGMAGFSSGVIDPSTTFHCSGSGTFFGRRFRCWNRNGHGTVNFQQAIKVSCDIYFYEVGARLGINRIEKYARLLTFGERSKIDLEGEKPGLVPSEEWARTEQKRHWYPSETISVAIGQGPLLVTALQMANMMAAVANGGTVFRPHVLRGIEGLGADGRPQFQQVRPETLHKVELQAEALDAVREGLWKVVNEPGGTGSNARVAGLDIAGKTGTVQVISQQGWVASESLPFKFRDHAWFTAFAPYQGAELVVVVFVEHGGHGGSEAAPLAKILFQSGLRKTASRREATARTDAGNNLHQPSRSER